MRILLWHGWLLEGSGSNVGTARVAETYRAGGHDVLLLCQEPHAERYEWIDAYGVIDRDGPRELAPASASHGPGRCVLLRPAIGTLLPVFVLDEYEGFEAKRFVDLTDAELGRYLDRNVEALRAASAWHGSEVVITGHAVPGPVVARRALGAGAYVAKIHGSDLEYAVRAQPRFRQLAHEGLEAARAVIGPSADVLHRCVELVPAVRALAERVPPGVDVRAFRARPRREALLAAAEALALDPDTDRGRPASVGAEVERALARRDADALERLATTYDQDVPDPEAPARLRALADRDRPIVGFFGKLIPQKGVHLLLAAAGSSAHRPALIVVGFGSFREWLEALAVALRTGDVDALAWLRAAGGMDLGPGPAPPPSSVTFTGRLDHRYAPEVLAAMDILVVPSVLEEAFGMVAVEGAASGALPLVARHSGLAEIAAALEGEVGRPGLFSYVPDGDPVDELTSGLDRLLALPADERAELRHAVAAFVGRTWSWTATAARYLDAAREGPSRASSGPSRGATPR